MKIKTQTPIYTFFLWLYGAFYVVGGLNHFLASSGYLKIMPQWLPNHLFLVYLSGVCEVIFGVMLLIPKYRQYGAWLIILMLIAFIPVHIFMIQKAPMSMARIEVTPLIAWLRLPLQVVLIAWAWVYTKKT